MVPRACGLHVKMPTVPEAFATPASSLPTGRQFSSCPSLKVLAIGDGLHCRCEE